MEVRIRKPNLLTTEVGGVYSFKGLMPRLTEGLSLSIF